MPLPPGHSPKDHHAQNHAARHRIGGMDPIAADYRRAVATSDYAEVTSNQLGLSSADITGLTVTTDVPANRKIRVIGHVFMQLNSTDNARFSVAINEGATELGRAFHKTTALDGEQMVSEGSAVLSPSEGSHTYKLRVERRSGTGDADSLASSTYPAWIAVEDWGPA